jgi:hypothetical protein
MKSLFLTMATALLFLSCNKSHNTGANYYITCSIDGINKSFAGNISATRTSDATGSVLNINGLFSQSATDGMDILVGWNNPNQPIGIGAYMDTSSVYSVLLTYSPSPTSTLYSGSNATSDSAFHHFTTINHIQIVIDSISSTEVLGKFSGDVFFGGNFSGDKKTIANGSFYAKFQ